MFIYNIIKDPEILRAHDKAREIFNHSEEEFLPHLSIVYGTLPVETKVKISKSLEPIESEFITLDRLMISDSINKDQDVWQEVKIFDLSKTSTDRSKWL